VPGLVLVLGADGNECAACRAHVRRPERCAGAPFGLDDPEPEECAPESARLGGGADQPKPHGKRNQRESANGTVIFLSRERLRLKVWRHS